MIAGRPISTYLLKKPMQWNHINVRCLEVPCPKPGRPYKSGFEHIEIVVGDKTNSCTDVEPILKF